MRQMHIGTILKGTFLAATLGATVACGDFLTVENPIVVDAAEIDPTAEAGTLALSVQQEFVEAYSRIAPTVGWFTGEIYNADINPGGNYIASRNLDETTGTSGVFTNMSRTRVLAELVISAVTGTDEEVSIAATRAEFYRGYSFLYMGEFYCQGSVGGPALSMVAMMDSVVHYLSRASTLAGQVGGETAQDFHDAALVGIARAHLHAGRGPQAITAAEAVRPEFEFFLTYSEDLANRSRVGNQIWEWIAGAHSQISVAPPYRNLGDPRVDVIPPDENNFVPFDGETPIWAPGKYTSHSSPIRLASKLEADYIVAEASGTQAMLDFVVDRRAANAQPAYDGPTDAQSVLEEFLEQRTRDFFLEGKRMGDYRRHPNGLRTLVPAGTPYHKVGLPAYKDLPCWPFPQEELDRNPNLGG
jgi:hypothetical protein